MSNSIYSLEDYQGYKIHPSLAKKLRNREQTTVAGKGRAPIYAERLHRAYNLKRGNIKYYKPLTPTLYTSHLKTDTLDITFFLGAGYLYAQDNINGVAIKLFDFLSGGDSLKRTPAYINEFPIPIRLRSAPLLYIFDLREQI